MGIKGLWTVLTPFSEKKSLHEIRGETVAVDLSGWVCDSQNVTDYCIQPKLYLRNLFFRTVYLLLADISPIFVLEGDAPELKQDVMAARNAIQFRGAAPKSDSAKTKVPNVSRKRFKGVLKECETLLKSMGVRCVKGQGEAEATCARLNAKGLVDAVVSQDSDCFAYGAKRVYRNFSVSSSAGGGAMQGSVDCYDAEKMFNSNGFGRKKMVALALLCGCDYGVGACGSSITTAIAFLHTVSEDQVINRLLSWVSEPQRYEEWRRWAAAGGCARCGHAGGAHARAGCAACATHRGCADVGHKSKVAEVKRELSLRSRALSAGVPFPEPKVMKEFLDATPEDIDVDSLKIPTPSLIQFVKIMSKKLDWTERYCVEKFLPLLTKWHLQEHVPCRSIKPIEIKKKRTPRGVPSYEVVWADIDRQYEALISDDQFEEGEDVQSPWTSIERQDLMRRYYPDIVEKYEESIKKPPKEKKGKGRKKKDREPDTGDQEVKPKRKYNRKHKQNKDTAVSNLNESMKNLNLTNKDMNSSKAHISVCVNKLKRKLKSNTKARVKYTIDSYLKPIKKRKSKLTETLLSESIVNTLNKSYENVAFDKEKCTPNITEFCQIQEDKHFLSMLDMSEKDLNDIDLSDIVEKVVSRAPKVTTAKVNSNLVKLIFENKQVNRKSIISQRLHKNNCSTPKSSPLRKSLHRATLSRRPSVSKVNTSYFFDKITDDCDAFEMSLEYKYNDDVHSDCDMTVEYSLPDVCM